MLAWDAVTVFTSALQVRWTCLLGISWPRYFQNKKYREAASIYEKLMRSEVDPVSMMEAVYWLAWSYYRAGEKDKALKKFNVILEKYPELEPMLNEVFSNLDSETIIELNARESIEGERRDVIARDYLKSQGYIK